MTINEAIQKLNGINLVRKWMMYEANEVEALDMAIEALQKQMPRKLVVKDQIIRHEYYDEVETEHYKQAYCPICKRSLGKIDFVIGQEYCQYCGQKLIWGEQEENE